MAICIVYRNDENAGSGAQFNDLRAAMEHIKSRASTEERTVRDYTMLPILQE